MKNIWISSLTKLLQAKPVNRILISPDKFKYSLSASQISQILQSNIHQIKKHKVIPLADGGEGSLDIIKKTINVQQANLTVLDPLFRPISSRYLTTSTQAYIEMSLASGLQLLNTSERNPLKTTTFGTGQLIKNCLMQGNRKINLLIGGSATNDAGMGMATALGYQFYDYQGKLLPGIGENLQKVSEIRSPNDQMVQRLKECQFSVYTDVVNQLLGENGATKIYSPQKGATSQMVQILQSGMRNLNNICINKFGVDGNKLIGGGAAGGLGAGSVIFLNATLKKGIDMLFQITKFQDQLKKADLVITGEGKFDLQTLKGKVVKGVIEKCKKHDKILVIICAISQVPPLTLQSYYSKAVCIELLSKQQQNKICAEITKQKIIQVTKIMNKILGQKNEQG